MEGQADEGPRFAALRASAPGPPRPRLTKARRVRRIAGRPVAAMEWIVKAVVSLAPIGFAITLIGLAGSGMANDSTAELATGGLVLTKTADIEMRSEDLFISPEEIRVTYHFFNRAPDDRTVTVAFPMPDIKLDFIDGM